MLFLVFYFFNNDEQESWGDMYFQRQKQKLGILAPGLLL